MTPTKRLKETVRNSMAEAIKTGQTSLSAEMVLYHILSDQESRGHKTLSALIGDKLTDLIDTAYQVVYHDTSKSNNIKKSVKELPFNSDVKKIFDMAENVASAIKDSKIDTGHVIYAMSLISDVKINKVLKQFIKPDEFKTTLKMMLSEDEETSNKKDEQNKPTNKPKPANTPILNNFCRDVTAMAEKNELDPVIGREDEIKRVVQILSRRKKNNPVLIGDPGVGKTSIIDGLATLIIQGKVPRMLVNKKIYSLSLTSVVAGTKFRGQFEERMKAMMDELTTNKNIILFVDELHTLVGAGNANGSLDAANIFKPALANGEIQIIGATTLDEYRENIEKDGALTRRFQQVLVDEPTVDETIQILMNIKSKYEDHHKVIYTDEAIEECVRMSDRYITDRAMPDKAIDVMDEAGSSSNISQEKPDSLKKLEDEMAKVNAEKLLSVKKQDFESAASCRDVGSKLQQQIIDETARWESELNQRKTVVDVDTVCSVMSNMTGIPLTKLSSQENKKLVEMPNALKKLVIGQDIAIDKVTQAIKRSRIGIKPKNKPTGVFIFLGPTGVGKSELSKKIAEQLFGDQDALIRLDMSEYQEQHTVSKMFGAPPGYVGYEQGGQLTEKVRRRPYSVILFDEIEKAHPEIFNSLLQLLDEGHMTDGLGRKVDFKNCLIIMTSNVGVSELNLSSKQLGFTTEHSKDNDAVRTRNIIEKAMKNKFPPEFINRVDETIVFNHLSVDDIKKIINIEINNLKERIVETGHDVNLDESAIEFLVKVGYDREYGARPLARAIQVHVGNLIADAYLGGLMKPRETVKLTANDGMDGLKIVTGSKTKK